MNYLVDYEDAIPMPPAGSESKDRDLLRRIEELTQANEKIQLSMYALAHDLTVPLRATRTYTELLLRRTEGKLEEESVQIPGNILRGLDRMKRLIHDVLEVAKASDPDVTTVPVDTRAVAQLALQNLRKPIEKAGVIMPFFPRRPTFSMASATPIREAWTCSRNQLALQPPSSKDLGISTLVSRQPSKLHHSPQPPRPRQFGSRSPGSLAWGSTSATVVCEQFDLRVFNPTQLIGTKQSHQLLPLDALRDLQ